VDAPAADLAAHLLEGVSADRRQERGEDAFAVTGWGLTCLECVAQERERRGRVGQASSPVPAVDDLRLVGVQPQPDLFHPVRQGVAHLEDLPLRGAVDHRVVGEPLELHGRELAFQPGVEGVMHEQVGQHG
jgi:hypothetical protein